MLISSTLLFMIFPLVGTGRNGSHFFSTILLHRPEILQNDLKRPVDIEYSSKELFGYIEKNYGDPFLSIKSTSKALHLSCYRINELLMDRARMKYKQYVNNYRVEKACRLLTTTDYSIAQIGETVGYCHANSFTRTFKKITGMVPNCYRKSYQK